MDLKDWMNVSNQLNSVAQVRDNQARTGLADRQLGLYERKFAADQADEAEQKDIERQTQELFNTWWTADQQSRGAAGGPSLPASVNPQATAPGSLAQGVTQGAAPSPQQPPAQPTAQTPDLSRYHPKAVSDATVLYEAGKSREMLRDRGLQDLIQQRAETSASAYGQALAKVDELAAAGRPDMAAELYASAYNEYFRDGYQASVDKETGELVLTSPTGKTARRPASDIPAMARSDRQVLNSQKFMEADVGAGLAAIGFNQKALLSPSPVVDKDGKTVAYRVRTVQRNGNQMVPTDTFYDSMYVATANRLTPEQVQSMGGMEVQEAERERDAAVNRKNREIMESGILTPEERKEAAAAAEKANTIVSGMLNKMYGQPDAGGKINPYYSYVTQAATNLNAAMANAGRGQMFGSDIASQTYSYVNAAVTDAEAAYADAVEKFGKDKAGDKDQFVGQYILRSVDQTVKGLEEKYGTGASNSENKNGPGAAKPKKKKRGQTRFGPEFSYMNSFRTQPDGTVFGATDLKNGGEEVMVTVRGGKFFDPDGNEVFFGVDPAGTGAPPVEAGPAPAYNSKESVKKADAPKAAPAASPGPNLKDGIRAATAPPEEVYRNSDGQEFSIPQITSPKVDGSGNIWGQYRGNTVRIDKRPNALVFAGGYVNPEYIRYKDLIGKLGLPVPADPPEMQGKPVAKNL